MKGSSMKNQPTTLKMDECKQRYTDLETGNAQIQNQEMTHAKKLRRNENQKAGMRR